MWQGRYRKDCFQENCGVFGIFNHPEAATLTYLGLYALQHRGQEGAGICTFDEFGLHHSKARGLVAEIFTAEKLRRLKGNKAIGHNRYSTTGQSKLKNVQPFYANYSFGSIAIGHNGNIVNSKSLREELQEKGAIFLSSTDTEVIIHLIAQSNEKNLIDRIIDSLKKVKGAYSLVILTENQLIGVRDPRGFRPLVIGRVDGAPVIASETCALDLIGAEDVRDVEAGEMIIINDDGIFSVKPFEKVKSSLCIFEFIYFARPDSYIFGRSVYDVRKEFGRQLARVNKVDADVVIPVPDSGVVAAIGYAEESGIPFDTGLIRNHYVGRTFIEPKQSIRNFGVKIKLNPVSSVLKGKRVVVIDDSIVRGTTSKKIVKMIRDAGAKEVHMRISSPPTEYPCFYGIDTPTREELIASFNSVEEIRDFVKADSLAYLSVEAMEECVKDNGSEFCKACFTGDYPVEPINEKKEQPRLL
ncbi:MAG: amidophosphoribosyltransferase [Candidatus Schekmanbacteria bacterium]|nr:MAG: amidophosphoribosyltransferase [Candidatus Schekmanbacteria bacterium]